jgi:hypothetical protein
MPRYAKGCICGRHTLESANEGTCLTCGHGFAQPVLRPRLNRRPRLPRDLASMQREGRRPRDAGNLIPLPRRLIELGFARPAGGTSNLGHAA